MTDLAPSLQAFFTDRLTNQRQASPRTITSYRDTFRLLLTYLRDVTGTPPAKVALEQLDADTIGDFLEHLESVRGNKARTRNARLAAIRSFFRYAAFRHPEHAALIQRVLAIPDKRWDRTEVSFLTTEEINAVLTAPDRATWEGRRDYVLVVVATQTGLRVSELTRLEWGDVVLDAGAHLHCTGKGRKERSTPLTPSTLRLLRSYRRDVGGDDSDPVFTTRTGRRLSPDAIERGLAKYAAVAETRCPSLRGKRVTPHVLRHSCAMSLLEAGVNETVIALWLGHEDPRSVKAYVHANLAIKERALARVSPPTTTHRRYRPPDKLLAFLEGL
jgi:integrase